jgi:hypothetical protein
VRVYVSRLRAKIEQESDRVRYIHTKPGVGYLFAAESDGGKSELVPRTVETFAEDGDGLIGNRSRRWRWATDTPAVRVNSPVN